MDGVGIPIIDKVPKTLEEMYVGRAKTGACYQAIIDDLDRAVGLLTQTDNHRVTVWSAKAFRAKACLFAGQNDKAKIDLEDCIHNSGKTLEPFERYRMMFNGYDEYEFNSESFYEMANKADPTNGSAYGNQNTGSTLSLYYPPFCIAPDSTRTAMSYGNQYMHDRNLPRFGYTDAAPLAEGMSFRKRSPTVRCATRSARSIRTNSLPTAGNWASGSRASPTRGSSSARCNPLLTRCR